MTEQTHYIATFQPDAKAGNPWTAAEVDLAKRLCFTACLKAGMVDSACDAANRRCRDDSHAVWESELVKARQALAVPPP